MTEQGVTYVVLMLSVVLIGVSLTVAAKHWKTMIQREKEADLIAKGIEIQNALAQYSVRMKIGRLVPGEVYPQSLVELTRPPKPLLRRVYPDPVSGADWEYIRAPTGGIMGVRSRVQTKPIKEHDFPLAVRHFEGRRTYRDWVFQHPNPSTAQQLLMPPTGVHQPIPPMPGQSANASSPSGQVPPSALPPGVAPGAPSPPPGPPTP